MRVRSRKGFSLGEMLVAVLILVMVSAVVAAGVPAAANAYFKVVDSANAQMLLSTTLTKLRSELSTATDVDCSGSPTITYCNALGVKSKITLVTTPNDKGEAGIFVELVGLSSGEGSSTDKYKQLLVSLKAASGMFMQYSGVAYSDGVITFTDLTVMKGEKPLASVGDYRIRVLTKTKTETEGHS